jgi:hypothetical protein
MIIGSSAFLIPFYSLNFWSGTKPSLPIFEMAFSNPNTLFYLSQSLSYRFSSQSLRTSDICAQITKLSGSNLRVGLISDPYLEAVKDISGDNPLGKFIFDNIPKLPKSTIDSLQMLPSFVPRSINLITTAILKAYLLSKVNPPKNWREYIWDSLDLDKKVAFEEEGFRGFREINASYAFQIICVLMDSLKEEIKRRGTEIKSFYLPTPYGYISFGSTKSDTFPNSLIVIDAGGDDFYKDVKIGLDFSGNDVYSGNVSFALFDISAFFDLDGNDRYDGEFVGGAFFGYGILGDFGGDDDYKCKVFCLGAGYKGGSMVLDFSGNDRYYSISKAQGFGWVGGVGILADVEGDDIYRLEDSALYFPSPQSPKHNTSLGQGMGFGERRDFFNGSSLGGGLGILLDIRGNDRYFSQVFSQGSGYWLGIGVLYDGGGNDEYSGVWYSQGASAHFGIGALYDISGDDVYHSSLSTSQGVGHDFSYGILIDGGGNDTYKCGNLCMGSGNAQGIGIMWDIDGNMKTHIAGKGLGFENPSSDGTSFRLHFPTKGFVCKGRSCP